MPHLRRPRPTPLSRAARMLGTARLLPGGAPSSCAGIVRTKKSESNARSARGRGGVRASFSTASPEESRPRKTPAAASSAPAAAGQSGRGV